MKVFNRTKISFNDCNKREPKKQAKHQYLWVLVGVDSKHSLWRWGQKIKSNEDDKNNRIFAMSVPPVFFQFVFFPFLVSEGMFYFHYSSELQLQFSCHINLDLGQ